MNVRLAAIIAVGMVAAPAVADTTYVRPLDAVEMACAAPGTPMAAAWTTGANVPGFAMVAAEEAANLHPPGAPDGGVRCLGTRYLRWHFSVGGERPSLASLTLSIAYQHGFVAFLNGVEIARRRVAAGGGPDAVASEPHGPEVEAITLPISVDGKALPLRAGDNVLAVEVHPRTAGHTASAEVGLAGHVGPRITHGPYLQALDEHHVQVRFETDLPVVGEVRWGDDERYGQVARDTTPTVLHTLVLQPLTAAHVYHYNASFVGAPSAAGPDLTPMHAVADPLSPFDLAPAVAGDVAFHTPPPAGRPLRFVVFGDVRSGHDVHAQLVRALLAEDPDLAVVNGDLVDAGSDDSDWDRFFQIAGPLLARVALFVAPGNHEYARLNRGRARFFKWFGAGGKAGATDHAWFSFDAAGVHFAALDSMAYGDHHQLDWLDQDLAAARRRGARVLFVFAHAGPYSSGLHGDNAVCIRDYVPLLLRHHVTAFFGGHDHDYERGEVNGLRYVVSGGGGAELREQRCGLPGKKACLPRVAELVDDHNYVAVEVLPSLVRVCPKRTDGTPLVPCTTWNL